MIEYKIDAPGDCGGDKTEKEAWPLFARDKFPSYELLWQQFVVPRTDRPNSIHFSQGVPLRDKEIAGIHYSILHSFCVVYKWLGEKEADGAIERQLFEYAYMKLSNICDLTEELLFKLLVLGGRIDSSSSQIVKAVSNDAKSKKIAEISKLTTGEALGALLKTGTSSVRLLNRVSILDDIFDFKAYKSLSEGIRAYRNVIVHSWQSFQINNEVPKSGYVKQYQDWARVTDVVKSNDAKAKQEMLKHFMPMRKLVQEQVDQLIDIINQLWAEVIPYIPSCARALSASYELLAPPPSPAGGAPSYTAAASGTIILPTHVNTENIVIITKE